MFLVFYKTNSVFLAEELLQHNKVTCEIVPTPVQDKAYCGVCLNVPISMKSVVSDLLEDIEYRVVEE